MAHPIGRCVIPKAYRPVGSFLWANGTSGSFIFRISRLLWTSFHRLGIPQKGGRDGESQGTAPAPQGRIGKGQGMAAEAQQRYPYGHTSPPDWGRRLESERAGREMGSFQSRDDKTADPDRIPRKRICLHDNENGEENSHGEEGTVI